MSKRYDKPSLEFLEHLYRVEGLSVAQIVDFVGAPRSTVRGWLREIPGYSEIRDSHVESMTGRPSIDPPPDEELLTHLNNGLSQEQLSSHYQVAPTTIKRWLGGIRAKSPASSHPQGEIAQSSEVRVS